MSNKYFKEAIPHQDFSCKWCGSLRVMGLMTGLESGCEGRLSAAGCCLDCGQHWSAEGLVRDLGVSIEGNSIVASCQVAVVRVGKTKESREP
jgi:hypothetical protein